MQAGPSPSFDGGNVAASGWFLTGGGAGAECEEDEEQDCK
jgi:hypothetical protein